MLPRIATENRLKDPRNSEVNMAQEDTADDPIAKRLSNLGFVPGRTVTPLRRAPLGDPVVYRVADYELCLRRHEARMVHVEVLTEADVVEPLTGQRADTTDREEQRP